MGIALHPYIVGQPYRLRHLRRALQHVAAARERGGRGSQRPARSARMAMRLQAGSMNFTIDDTVGAWVPHGRFVIAGARQARWPGLRSPRRTCSTSPATSPGPAIPPGWRPIPRRRAAAALVAELLAAGATLMGKVVTDELAYSLHGDNMHYGAPINSRAPERVTGRLVQRLGCSGGGADWSTSHSAPTPAAPPACRPATAACWAAADARPAVGRGTGAAAPAATTHPPGWREMPRCSSVLRPYCCPAADFAPQRVLRFDDAVALADADFGAPLALRAACAGTAISARPALGVARQRRSSNAGAATTSPPAHTKAGRCMATGSRAHRPVFAPGHRGALAPQQAA